MSTGSNNSMITEEVTLLLVLFSCLFIQGHSEECVNGLMSAERVRRLGNIAGDRRDNLREQQQIIPDISFSCSGTVSRWIVAGNERNEHNEPEVQIWRETFNGSGVYTKVHGMSLPERAEDSSLIYEFTATMDVQLGDILGLFEPEDSWLRLYYTDQYGPVNYYMDTGDDVTPPTGDFDISGAATMHGMPLVTVEFSQTDGSSASECIRQFATMDQVMIGVQQMEGGRPIQEEEREQRLIPDINFTCHGFITKWILAAMWADEDVYPELQTWNSTDGITYTKQGATTFSLEGGSAVMTYYEYSPNSPHEFNDGDVLGMFIPDKSRYKLFFERTDSGPENYVEDMADSAGSDFTTNSGGIQITSAVPLIAVEVSIPQPSMPPLSVTPGSSATPVPEPEDPSSKSGSSSSDASGTIAAVVVVVLIVVSLAGIVGVSIAVIVVKLKRKDYDLHSPSGLTNPVYQGETVQLGAKEKSSVMEPIYHVPEVTVYEDLEASAYLEPTTSATISQSYYVPTEDQRRGFENSQNIYSSLSIASYTSEENYFPESEIYWAPASTKSDLYAQLAQNKFREIPRPLVRICEHLGTGNFGQVNKGVWESPSGSMEVAVKALRPGASEIDRVKFLQEAAIMGQFHHPNVIALHGVVTVVEPVMIVLELMSSGDLRQYLIKLQPIPGEMVPSNTSQMCLDFCFQIASGMEYLSKKAFVHRDLAARNILVSDQRTCKISDFGMARDLEDEDYYVSHGGKIPVKWTAPEAINYKKYSTASDVWSYGALMYEIWSLGHKPFEGYTNMQTVSMVNGGWRLPPSPGCPKAVYELMVSCWHPQAGSRPSFSDLLQSLSQPETELLHWTGEDTKTHPQAAVLGAPLEAGKDLYPELQGIYQDS